jgi:U32 family peptidase
VEYTKRQELINIIAKNSRLLPTTQSPAPMTSSPSHKPELLAPAGDWDCVKAAVENGADAIYFGLDRFNARMRAENFSSADLPELMAFLHQRGVKGYLTLNTLIFPTELPAVEEYLKTAIRAGVDAAIVQDVGICRSIRHISPDWPIHASTQMTITSAAGVQFAQDLGCNLVVLARECSIAEISKIQQQLGPAKLPLEIFVHGALCVAYSGQCLTSESLGGRSANRGECAQACRLPYELVANGYKVDLGDRQYLLSPQDLAGLELLPQIVAAGISCLKIEGRLKTPEYVASVTKIYRQAIDSLDYQSIDPGRNHFVPTTGDRYQLEMAFSRGLATGWLGGIDNQMLVHGEFSSKQGVFVGEVVQVGRREIIIQTPIKPGDGLAIGNSGLGGRVYTVDTDDDIAQVGFNWEQVDLRAIEIGDKIWKTSDPELEKQVRQTYTTEKIGATQALNIVANGEVGAALELIATDQQGHEVRVVSEMVLSIAQNKPLTAAKLQEQLGRLGNTPFHLGELTWAISEQVMLPVSELNRLRREIVTQMLALRTAPRVWQLHENRSFADLIPKIATIISLPQINVLVRTLEQLEAAVSAAVPQIYCEFSNPHDYRSAASLADQAQLFAVPPRITKSNEQWTLKQLDACNPSGYLVRNYDQLGLFAGKRCIGDFSLNIANAITADYFQQLGLERLTASYDLNINQLTDLITSYSPHLLEVTIHQHMPMFHMEHCVFCAFLSTGKDYQDCGRPCDTQQVELVDRVGTAHILQADIGCRNTLYNGVAQTGAEYLVDLLDLGIRHFRLEFLREDGQKVEEAIDQYRQLLAGTISGSQLWQRLQLRNQLGVTRGTLSNSTAAR